jgi:Fur family ferric uptake transcriptional regulator
MDTELEVIFAREQLRLTAPRKAVFRLLHTADAPLAIADIAGRCQGTDRVSVYRTIELFQGLGIVRAVPLGWKQLYELTSPFKAHHHHLSCTQCGRLLDVHSKKFEQLVASVSKEYGFTPQDHTFEIKGLCSDCR